MSEFRRRQMMTACAEKYLGYVEDGLVLLLDGIEKGDNQNTWTSLVNGEKFTIVKGTTIFNTDNVEFDGNSVLRYGYNILFAKYQNGTIECVFNETGVNSNWTLFASTRLNNVGISLGRRSGICISTGQNTPTYPTISKGSISVSASRAFYNGVANNVTSYNSNISSGSGYNFIGGAYYGGGYMGYLTGKIYSIRIYNRQLTESEILHNLSIDRQRFTFLTNM